MKPRTRPLIPASIGSNQASPANSSPPFIRVVVLSCSMAWSPPARQRRSWLVEQVGGYAKPNFHHIRDGTHPCRRGANASVGGVGDCTEPDRLSRRCGGAFGH